MRIRMRIRMRMRMRIRRGRGARFRGKWGFPSPFCSSVGRRRGGQANCGLGIGRLGEWGEGDASEVDLAAFGLETDGPGNDVHPLDLVDELAVEPDAIGAALGEDLDAVPFAGGEFGVGGFLDAVDVAGDFVVGDVEVAGLVGVEAHAVEGEDVAGIAVHELDFGTAGQGAGGAMDT